MEWIPNVGLNVRPIVGLFVGLFVAAAAFSVWQGVRRARQLALLAERGQRLHGTIVARRSVRRRSGPPRYRITYEYPAATSIKRGTSIVSAARYASCAEGDPIDLAYLPDQPDVVAPRFVVDEAAAAVAQARKKP